jgi:Peptidase_C39 like family
MSRRRFLTALAAAAALALAAAAPTFASQPYPVSFHSFPLSAGQGTTLTKSGALTLASNGLATKTYTDPYLGTTRTYQVGTWTSPEWSTGFGFTELVSSWIAQTPAGSFIRVYMHADRGDGTFTKWYTMGIWASGDADIYRTSVGGQGDNDGFIAIDTFFAHDHPMVGYQLQLELYRPVGSSATPSVTRISAVASDPVNTKPYLPSATTMTKTTVLPVPSYSQEIHAGQYPQYDSGGEAWCSPTSTSMVVSYWGKGPSPADYAYVLNDYPGTPDPWVDYAARFTFDYHYNGAGNWPFNVAYAGSFGLDGEVTQLHSLAEAEQFIKAGIPLVASIAFTSNKLDGFLFKSTAGHLLVIVGFDKEGNPIVNDPAATSDAAVQRTYDRAQFEQDWMTATGGIVYVIHPSSVALPASLGGNW